MAYTHLVRPIAAPAAVVFRAVAEIDDFAKAIEGVERVEFLTPQRTGAGTKYRTTRVMQGKRHTMDFEVVEHRPPHHVRIVNEVHGTVWDSTFDVRATGAATSELTMTMTATSRRLLPRIVVALIRPMVNRSVGKDLDAVKRWCESTRAPTGTIGPRT
jgi:carbon monoxide dehydrogenase subunit G